MNTAGHTDLDITDRKPIAHAIRVDPASFPAGDYEVTYTCSARCCLNELNRLGVAPNEYVYTGSGRWGRYTWGTVTGPDLLEGRHCAACGLPISDRTAEPDDMPGQTTANAAAPADPARDSLGVEQSLPKLVFGRIA